MRKGARNCRFFILATWRFRLAAKGLCSARRRDFRRFRWLRVGMRGGVLLGDESDRAGAHIPLTGPYEVAIINKSLIYNGIDY